MIASSTPETRKRIERPFLLMGRGVTDRRRLRFGRRLRLRRRRDCGGVPSAERRRRSVDEALARRHWRLRSGEREHRVPHRLRVLRLRQPLAVELRDDHGDVVRTAILVRAIDELPARGEQIAVALLQDLRDLVLPHEPRQSIGAQHERVALAHLLVGEVDLHRGLGAERLEDDVAALAALRLFRRELARLDEPLHQRLILRDLQRDAVAHEIRAAVAHLREIERVAE